MRVKQLCAYALAASFFLPSLHAAEAVPVMKVGGVEMKLPAPGDGFAEVGDQLRTTVFDMMAPSSNRLVGAYLATEKLEALRAKSLSDGLGTYGLLQVPRQDEYSEVTVEEFAKGKTELGAAFGGSNASKTLAASIDDANAEMALRLKAFNVSKMELGKPEMLGTFFDKPRAAGWGMLLAVQVAGKDGAAPTLVTMAGGIGAVTVKQRILLVYLYQRYVGPETVTALKGMMEHWTDAIVAANQ